MHHMYGSRLREESLLGTFLTSFSLSAMWLVHGSGFGPAGEGFFRLSAFGHRENVEKAVSSIKEKLQL